MEENIAYEVIKQSLESELALSNIGGLHGDITTVAIVDTTILQRKERHTLAIGDKVVLRPKEYYIPRNKGYKLHSETIRIRKKRTNATD